MTGVDKLHAQGLTGKGIKIGIIDTGTDYTNPYLGGGFGPGFKGARNLSYYLRSLNLYCQFSVDTISLETLILAKRAQFQFPITTLWINAKAMEPTLLVSLVLTLETHITSLELRTKLPLRVIGSLDVQDKFRTIVSVYRRYSRNSC